MVDAHHHPNNDDDVELSLVIDEVVSFLSCVDTGDSDDTCAFLLLVGGGVGVYVVLDDMIGGFISSSSSSESESYSRLRRDGISSSSKVVHR